LRSPTLFRGKSSPLNAGLHCLSTPVTRPVAGNHHPFNSENCLFSPLGVNGLYIPRLPVTSFRNLACELCSLVFYAICMLALSTFLPGAVLRSNPSVEVRQCEGTDQLVGVARGCWLLLGIFHPIQSHITKPFQLSRSEDGSIAIECSHSLSSFTRVGIGPSPHPLCD